MLFIRNAMCEDDSPLPAEALYGSQLVLPGQLLSNPEPPASFYPGLERAMADFIPAPPRHNLSKSAPLPAAIPEALYTCPFVFVRKDGHKPPLAPVYDGPYRVLRRSPNVFLIQLGSRVDSVSVHRLKAASLPPDAVPADPPRRGRPPSTPHQPPAPPSGPLHSSPDGGLKRVRFADLPPPSSSGGNKKRVRFTDSSSPPTRPRRQCGNYRQSN